MSERRVLRFGEALPHHARVASNRNAHFPVHTMAGRFVLICVVLDLARPEVRGALTRFRDDQTVEGVRVKALWCGDPAQGDDALVADIARSNLVFQDGDRAALRELGLVDEDADPAGRWLLLDPTLRVLGAWPMHEAEAALAALQASPDPSDHAGALLHAPVLVVPRIFEPPFCSKLIAHFNEAGGVASGTTRENAEGKTFVGSDPNFKRRADVIIEDPALREAAMRRLFWRLLPEIEKAFVFRATRIERYLVACYDSTSGGFFKPHRDNTTKGTAHRRFAVTLNLNSEEYEGGDLRFPEFGSRTYRAPTGGAVVFSCSLLHEATPVTHGKRYAFLPFLYDEEGAKLREANNAYLDEGVGGYTR